MINLGHRWIPQWIAKWIQRPSQPVIIQGYQFKDQATINLYAVKMAHLETQSTVDLASRVFVQYRGYQNDYRNPVPFMDFTFGLYNADLFPITVTGPLEGKVRVGSSYLDGKLELVESSGYQAPVPRCFSRNLVLRQYFSTADENQLGPFVMAWRYFDFSQVSVMVSSSVSRTPEKLYLLLAPSVYVTPSLSRRPKSPIG